MTFLYLFWTGFSPAAITGYGWLEYEVGGRCHYAVSGRTQYEVGGRVHFTVNENE